MFEDFEKEIVEKIEQKLCEQEEQITHQESTLALRENTIENLLVACDDNDQYSRRNCLRINGIATEKDKEDSVLKKLKACYEQ